MNPMTSEIHSRSHIDLLQAQAQTYRLLQANRQTSSKHSLGLIQKLMASVSRLRGFKKAQNRVQV